MNNRSPALRFGVVNPLAAIRSLVLIPKRNAMISSVSLDCTRYSQPLSRGIVSTWPGNNRFEE